MSSSSPSSRKFRKKPARNAAPGRKTGGGGVRAEASVVGAESITDALPSKEKLLEFIRGQEGRVGKREIAKAFNIKGGDRIALKRMLSELTEDGELQKGRRRFQQPMREGADLPPVLVLEAGKLDSDGELTARPAQWSEETPPPPIVLGTPKKHDPALAPGDRFLGRLVKLEDSPYRYEARLVKKLGRGAKRLLGLFRETAKGGRVVPVEKRCRDSDELIVEPGSEHGARDGELVEVEALPGSRFGLKRGRVLDRLGDATAPKSISLIAVHEQGIPVDFPEEALAEARVAKPVTDLAGRTDLRDLPLVTIDPADARDHDDAVYAMADDDPTNPGGWVVWVAIADVAYYVRPGSELDRAARDRGNSAYFPDRVVPMLPDRLSGDLCSLHEGVDRPCMAVRIQLAEDGSKRGHDFHRAMMRSAASLTYEQAQQAWEGEADEASAPLLDSVITPLYRAYHAARQAHEKRSPLDLDLPERRVILNAEGEVESIRFRDRFDAHRLIEEFMILANVCAAETLEQHRTPLLYRVHEEPSPTKIEALRDILASIDIPLAKGQTLTPRLLNRALDRAAETEHAELVNMAVLRAQTQAYYAPENMGHFGLALARYAHFTSPIRRYADLVVHRALISALKMGPEAKKDGLSGYDREHMAATGEHISMTERRAMTAERDTIDRYLAAYLADRRGATFDGRISGVQRFGLFVKLAESGADGFVPIGSLGMDYFHYDEAGARLVGDRSGVELRMGQNVKVRLKEATPVTGGMIFELLDLPSGRKRGTSRAPTATARRATRERLEKSKEARKQRRRQGVRKKR